MKRVLSRSVSAGIALALLTGPFAFAQTEQHGQPDSARHEAPGAVSHGPVSHGPVSQGPVGHEQAGYQQAGHEQEGHRTASHPPASHQAPAHQPAGHEAASHQNGVHQNAGHTPGPMDQHGAAAHRWRRGDHYSGSRQVVTDWHSHNLRQPPHGEEWVQNGSQFVLIAIASGVVADVLLNGR